MNDHLFILAGEASGDKLGGLILKEMSSRGFKPRLSGVGGNDMSKFGLSPIFPMEELSIIGISSAVKNYFHLKRRMMALVDHIRTEKPRMVITIDTKAFSLRLGKELKKVMAKEGWHVPIVHLVAPTVWAWGSWRAKNMPACVDHLMCLFPFEVPYFTRYNVSTSAVGHPALHTKFPTRKAARTALGLADDDVVVGLFPGSRRREVATLLPDMCGAITELRADYPALKAVIPAAPPVEDAIKEFLTQDDDIICVGEDSRYDVMKAADAGLICSGTVTLETALAGLPGHVYYRTDFLTEIIAKLIMNLDKVVLANAVTEKVIYDCAFQKQFNSHVMAEHIRGMLKQHTNRNDMALAIKNALTPDDINSKRAGNFEVNVVDRIDEILNDF